jgi:hypothetical protein
LHPRIRRHGIPVHPVRLAAKCFHARISDSQNGVRAERGGRRSHSRRRSRTFVLASSTISSARPERIVRVA